MTESELAKIPKLDFTKSVTFFLGAGASSPYGFPLGRDLRDMLIHANLSGAGFDESFVASFHEALRYSDIPTIDLFLEKKRRFREIGAYSITASGRSRPAISPKRLVSNPFPHAAVR